MLEIKRTEEFQYDEIIGKKVLFTLDDIEGEYLYEENWYEPLDYRFMKIRWNGCTILWDGEYQIKGTMPSDTQLLELSSIFGIALYVCVKNGKYKTFV